MSDDALLDHAARLIADARIACLKLAIPPEEIARGGSDYLAVGGGLNVRDVNRRRPRLHGRRVWPHVHEPVCLVIASEVQLSRPHRHS